MKVSIIIPFVSLSEKQRGHLHKFKNTNYDTTVLTTIEAIRNINKVLKKVDKEANNTARLILVGSASLLLLQAMIFLAF